MDHWNSTAVIERKYVIYCQRIRHIEWQSGMPHLIIAFFFLPLSFLPFTIHTLQIVIEHVTTNTADDTMIAIISSRESSKLELLSTVTEMKECM